MQNVRQSYKLHYLRSVARQNKPTHLPKWDQSQGTKVGGGFVKRKEMMLKFGVEAELVNNKLEVTKIPKLSSISGQGISGDFLF